MEFFVLGPVEVRVGGSAVQLGGHKQRGLLALLLLNAGEVVPAERLIDALWGERPPPSALNSVHVYVSQLRKALGDGRLVTREPGYLLDVRPDELDARRFERLLGEARTVRARGNPSGAKELLVEALALWRGSPLADLGHEEFAQGEIARLEELRLVALEERVGADLELGRATDLVPELEELVRSNPLRERAREQLMLALYRSGRQAEALQAYQAARQTLVEDLGLEPSDSLRQLQRAILAHDPVLAPPARPNDAAPSVTRRRPRRWIAAAVALAGAIVVAFVALGRGSSAVAVSANSIAIIDPKTSRVIGDVQVGSGPNAVAFGAGGVWVANGGDGTVMRIDPRTRKVVSTIGIGADVSDVAVGFGSVWVANGNDGTLTRIDPLQNAVQATFRFGSSNGLSPQPLFSVTTGDHGVWVTRGDRLLRIDPASGQVTLSVGVEPPVGLAEHDGIVWVTTTVDHVLQLAATTGLVTGSVSLPDRGIAPLLARNSLWMIVGNPGEAPRASKIWQIDPDTGSTTATAPGAFAVDLAAGAGAIWVACSNGTVVRIDPATDEAAKTFQIGHEPSAVAFGARAVWVAVRSAT